MKTPTLYFQLQTAQLLGVCGYRPMLSHASFVVSGLYNHFLLSRCLSKKHSQLYSHSSMTQSP
ncbi:hypothetical protein SORBI_3003G030450 [Sorghum bicolor]|uniref:Uncharacterized protein n=1 Tax=Sorghum bicolor TaxID=4558 RepID=A0A1W0VVK4_SORBI|nr:hypothetical protein SORBI_3003G030450 [Sorghum bicolor]